MGREKEISKKLRLLIDIPEEKRARFFKTGKGDYAEHDRFLGLKVPTVRKCAKEYSDLSFEEIEVLLNSKYNEERMLALFIMIARFEKSDEKKRIYDFYLKNIKRVNNWNLVDISAHLIVGAYLLDRDKSILLHFAKSKEMWERRIAIVATWFFIKSGELTWTIKLANVLMKDEHDLIHKATGWMLRELGKKDKSKLLNFLDQSAFKMPRTSLRYAIERLSREERDQYMQLKRVL